jgi:hypothetical protein
MPQKPFRILARVIHEVIGKAVPDLRVEAWDQDLIFDENKALNMKSETNKLCVLENQISRGQRPYARNREQPSALPESHDMKF